MSHFAFVNPGGPLVPDIAKAKRMLDYNPRVPIEDGIARFVDWYEHQTA